MLFNEIIGHKTIKAKLVHAAFAGRISHTQLFAGPEGCGNLGLAIAYAQFINCLNPQQNDSCGTCASCVKFNKLEHPDLHFTIPTVSPYKLTAEVLATFREHLLANPYLSGNEWVSLLSAGENKQGNITAEETRDIITRLSFKSYEAKYKIQIIWMPEYLDKTGNMLLKLLEEPPPATIILLVANQANDILPTILSRTQLVKIPRIDDESITSTLIQKYGVEPTKANDICRISEGNMSYALRLLDVENTGYFELFSTWMRLCYSGKVAEIQKWIDEMTEHGREYLKSFLLYSLQMIRAGFVYKYADKQLLRVNSNEIAFLQNFTKFLSMQNLPPIAEAVNKSFYHLERNANMKIVFLNLSLYIGKQIKLAQKAA
jgi:DNA polymerase-3 subunit delta'